MNVIKSTSTLAMLASPVAI